MDSEIVYKSEFVLIIKEDKNYFIKSLKPGMSINSFNDILLKFPEIKITNFSAIKNSLISINSNQEKFGESKPRICLDFSQDLMKAYITLCVNENEFEVENRGILVLEIAKVLAESGIKEGIKLGEIAESGLLCNGKQILIAEGTRPVRGEDSVVSRYVFHMATPKVSENNSVDFYEIDLINRVAEKDIVGQWTAPTMGIQGVNIKGEKIEAESGKNITIAYDPATIYEESANGITKLFAAKVGAIELVDNVLTVMDHMEVPENVNFTTGNLNFDGSITIKGIVEDTFSVAATKDIEIQSSQGLGSVKEICSSEGSIFIKGGVNGKDRSIIRAQKNIYLKYAKDVSIICEGTVNIGAYAFNCNIKANQVIVESTSGQIVGGVIDVVSKVTCPIIGSLSEIPTKICFSGIDRYGVSENISKLIKETDNVKMQLSKSEQELAAFKGVKAGPEELKNLKIKMNEVISLKNKIKEMEKDKKEMQDSLKIKGDCELLVAKNIYPNSTIMMKHLLKKVEETMGSTRLILEEDEIKQL